MRSEKPMPPRLATRILKAFLRDDLVEEVVGDLQEKFDRQQRNGSLFRAGMNYWYQVFHYMRPFALRKMKYTQNNFAMYRHNLLVSYRNFKRYKGSFFINLVGLSTGLAAAFMIYLWVNDELSFDKFHEKDSQLYQVMERRTISGKIFMSDESTGILAETLKEEMPEVEYAASMVPSSWFQKFTLSLGEKNVKASGQYVGKDYFNIFTFPLIQGDKDQVLADKNSIVISETLAMRLFNTTENVVGKAVQYQREREFIVSGIFKDVPHNSSEQFEFLLSFEYYKDIQGWVKNWGANGPHNFVILKEGTDIDNFNRKIAGIISKHSGPEGKYREVFVLPFSDNYLLNTFDHGTRQGGRIEYVRLFSIIAVLILAIACINFMNLSTARASRRMKEIGIKKAIGSRRNSLVVQYISESMLMSLISAICALGIVALLIPEFNELTGKHVALTFDSKILMAIAAIIFITGLISGSYPAFYLSGFNPAVVLKGKLNTTTGEVWIRKGLVVFQFVMTVSLVVGVLVVYKQIEFIQTSNMGYNRDNIIRFDSEGRVLNNQQTFMRELRRIPGVVSVSGTWHNIIGRNFATDNISWEGKNPEEKIFFEGLGGDYNLLETLGIKIIEGKAYAEGPNENSDQIILNEAAVKIMGLKTPVGQTIKLFGNNRQIIGVMKDFHFESVHQKVGPMYHSITTGGSDSWYKILVKIKAGQEHATIERIQKFYASYNPGFTLDYYFLDEAFQRMYSSENRIAVLSRYFAAIAIVISCLGLFGLAAFTAERRVKEIGIRKILGSSRMSIVYLLSSEFTKIVAIAIIVALPASYFMTSQWLSNFAYKIDLSFWIFVVSGGGALVLSWLTIGLQTIRAASVNPVACLKSE